MSFIQYIYLIHVIAGDVRIMCMHMDNNSKRKHASTFYYVQPAVLFTSLSPCVYWT